MPLNLRPAKPTELPTVAALMNLAYRATGPTASWNTESSFLSGVRTSEQALRDDLATKPQATLLVHTGPEPEAPVQASVWLEPKSPTRWYVGALTVDPALQSAGLGGQLLTAAEHWAAERGATAIEMSVVNIRETLIAWYNRRGYHLTGETHPFPYGDQRFGTPLRDDLTFLVLEKLLPQNPQLPPTATTPTPEP